MWTFGACEGVRTHPVHPPGYGPGLPLYPLDFRASLYNCEDLLNSFESQDKFEILLLFEAGICLITEGGWLDLALLYNGLLSGFLNG